MPTMHHPTIVDVSVEVPADHVGDWRDQGWKAPGVPDERPKSAKD